MGPQYTGYYGQPAPGRLSLKKILVIGGIVLFLVIGLIVVSGIVTKANSIDVQTSHLSARLSALTSLTTDAPTKLSSGDLKKINAETSIITAGVQSRLAASLPKKIDKTVTAAETDTSSTTRLADAVLAGTYDTEYKSVLQAKLESINALLTETYNKTKSASLKTSLTDSYNDYAALLKRLENTN